MFGFSKRTSPPKANIQLPEPVLASLQALRVDLGTLEPLFEPPRSNAYVFPSKGKSAPALWENLRKKLPALAYWPAILGDDDSLARHRESAAEFASSSDIMARAASIRVDELFGRWRQGFIDPDDPEAPPLEDGELFEKAEAPRPFYTCFHPLSGMAYPRVWVGLFPTADGSEIPAHLGFGDWNACPKPHEHVAVLKHWASQYGTELAAIASDIIELRAARRPATRDAALALAREQFYYCSDIVDQGVGSITTLAKVLMENDFWYFWWD